MAAQLRRGFEISFPSLIAEAWAEEEENTDAAKEEVFEAGLRNLERAIMNHSVTRFADVIFYAPAMKQQLLSFIKRVQAAFEKEGDVTAKKFRFMMVSEDKEALRDLRQTLAKEGVLAGVEFYSAHEDTEAEWDRLAQSLNGELKRGGFEEHFFIFDPNDVFAKFFPAVRVVHSEVRKDVSAALLPDFTRYYASTTTPQINAATLRQAIPDFASSLALRPDGVHILTAFLDLLAGRLRKIAESA